MKRKKLTRNKSKKMFTRTAQGKHKKNKPRSASMRGGIRL